MDWREVLMALLVILLVSQGAPENLELTPEHIGELALLGLLEWNYYQNPPIRQETTIVMINETITIPSQSYIRYPVYVDKYGKLNVSVTATQSVDVYLFDEENYHKYMKGYEATLKMGGKDVNSFNNTCVASPTEKEYLVIFNHNIQPSPDVTVKVVFTY
jgi:hypothetical protein